MATYGYCRCSTKTQRLERQINEIKKYCENNKIEEPTAYFKDKWTGRVLDRPSWNLLMKKIKPHDTIIFESVSRMSRNKEDGYNEYFRLYDSGVNLIFTKEPHINTSSYTDAMSKANIDMSIVDTVEDYAAKALLQGVLSSVDSFMKIKVKQDIERAFEASEQEVLILSKRTSEGMAVAAAKGHRPGRPLGSTYETYKGRETKEAILKYSKDFNGTLKDKELIALLSGSGKKVARSSYYKYKDQLIKAQGPDVSTS